jgi:ABC-type Mn2+/Zn2+ transport system permease subunit
MIAWLTDPLSHAIVVRGILELTLLGLVSGGLGCWIVLSGLSYSAESLAHGMLPGLVAAALLGVPVLLGGAVGLLVAALAIALVARVPRLDGDVAVSVVVTALLGLGVLMGLSPRTPAGLGQILFGDVLGVGGGELALAGGLALVTVVALAVLHPSLLAIGFDRGGASAAGRRPAPYDAVLAVLLAAATLVAVQALGNLLVVAMLVGPAATARLLCDRMAPMMLTATLVAFAGSVAGLYLSYHASVAAGASVTLMILALYVLALTWRTAFSRGSRRRRRAAGSRAR